jgi:phage shock protein C
MNGTSRLYRSTSEAMLGGVAAGLGNYFKLDPVIIRGAFIILTLLTGGAFLVVYLAMWLLVPTAGSTATQPGEIVQENLNDMGSRVRSFTGMSAGNPSTGNPSAPAAGNGGTPTNAAPNTTNIVPSQSGTASRPGIGPIILISLGLLFLLGNMGFFHLFIWRAWWPLMLIALGVLLISRRRR